MTAEKKKSRSLVVSRPCAAGLAGPSFAGWALSRIRAGRRSHASAIPATTFEHLGLIEVSPESRHGHVHRLRPGLDDPKTRRGARAQRDVDLHGALASLRGSETWFLRLRAMAESRHPCRATPGPGRAAGRSFLSAITAEFLPRRLGIAATPPCRMNSTNRVRNPAGAPEEVWLDSFQDYFVRRGGAPRAGRIAL